MSHRGHLSELQSRALTPHLDWTSLPHGVDSISLWGCLHDGRIVAIASDRLARTLTIDVDVFYIREHHGLPDSYRFRLAIHGVTAARAARYVAWPGGYAASAGASRDEEARAIADYQAKWREESVTWDDFERVTSNGDHEILEASFARGEGVAVRFYCATNEGNAHDVVVCGERLSVTGSDGAEIGVEQLIAMGEAYWDAFAARTPAKQ